MNPSAQDHGRSAQDGTSSIDGVQTLSAGDQDISALRRALQEQRRATTLLHAEREQERQLREALEAQLVEANAEIVSSWDRRKEMARVLGELQTRFAQVSAERKDLSQQIAKLERTVAQREQTISKLEQIVSNRDQAISKLEQVVAQRDQVIANREEALAKRDVALSKREMVIANRDEKIRQLKAELQARYEDVAALQRHMVDSTLSGKAKRLAGKAKGFARKTFQG